MPASRQINNQKSNHLVTHSALERASEYFTNWWDDAFLTGSDDSRSLFFIEVAQTLPLLIESPAPTDIIDAMKMHRIRLAKIRDCGRGSLGKQRCMVCPSRLDFNKRSGMTQV
jgi:hypothetical protein